MKQAGPAGARLPRRLGSGLLAGTLLTVLLTVSFQAVAYEPGTTHPGLTTQAVLQSGLHRFLREQAGVSLGLFQRLTLRASAMDQRQLRHLRLQLDRLDPTGGYRPDPRLGQGAAAWLLAGSVLAGMPYTAERDHFYCPPLRSGLQENAAVLDTLLSLLATVEGSSGLRQLLTGTGFGLRGKAAVKVAFDPEERPSIPAFYAHLQTALVEASPREREHHLALALLSLGGVLHLLQDLASPTRTRNDYRVGHLQRLGESDFFRGSAYEHLVALAYGQRGLPQYRGQPIVRERLQHYFSSPSWDGLADHTTTGFFSPGTLPPPASVLPTTDPQELRRRLETQLPLAQPGLQPLDLACASRGPCHMKGRHGPLLVYRIERRTTLRFSLDSACYTAAARYLLPLAVGYSAGLIDHLLRGELGLEAARSGYTLINKGKPLTAGFAQLLAEDAAGQRQVLQDVKLQLPSKTGQTLARLELVPPPTARWLIVVLSGTDEQGDPLVAAARIELAAPASQPSQPTTQPAKSARFPRRNEGPRDLPGPPSPPVNAP